MVELLLQKRVSMGAEGWHDHSSLHLAALHGHASTVEVLLRNGASMEVKDRAGQLYSITLGMLHAGVIPGRWSYFLGKVPWLALLK